MCSPPRNALPTPAQRRPMASGWHSGLERWRHTMHDAARALDNVSGSFGEVYASRQARCRSPRDGERYEARLERWRCTMRDARRALDDVSDGSGEVVCSVQASMQARCRSPRDEERGEPRIGRWRHAMHDAPRALDGVSDRLGSVRTPRPARRRPSRDGQRLALGSRTLEAHHA
jgi:hypothetical protein